MKKKREPMLNDTVWRMVRDTRPIRKWLILSALLSTGIIVCSIATPELLGRLIDRLYAWLQTDRASSLIRDLIPGLLLLFAVYAANAGITYGNSYLLNHVVSRFYTAGLRIRMSDKLQRLPVSYMDRTKAGEIIEKMQEDVSSMGNSIHGIIEILVTGFLQILAIAVVMFLKSWLLALAVLAIMPLSLWLSSRLASLSEKSWHSAFDYFGKMYSAVEESYTNFPATKAFNLEGHVQQHHDAINAEHQEVARKANFLQSIVQPIIIFTNALAYILIALLGGWLIVYRSVPVGTVVTVILFAKQLSAPLERIASGFGELQMVKASAKRVYDVLDLPEEARPAESLQGKTEGNIRFEHVNFSYSEEKPLIEDLCIDVKKGQNVAIVGPTGAGKTTIVNLLMRFYDLKGGKILIDGQDVAALSRDSTRDLFGMVLQDTWLFNGTIAENVAYGKPDATREEIVEACDRAYCDHFIRTLPKGYDTVISEDTTTISAGQKQLLTIARALLANKQLLILDEATSNVDTRTEILIQKAMDKLMKDRTCFVIAHRLSTIVDSDLILVLNHGQIVEQGTHRELLEKQGFYYEIYTSQYAI
ncbi:MAG: ABC transporter ATP-binding protein [Oscillospiraceae bacterium]|nr:ABC transporter ATP-binding protein [Oscillospiraceae bacterium]